MAIANELKIEFNRTEDSESFEPNGRKHSATMISSSMDMVAQETLKASKLYGRKAFGIDEDLVIEFSENQYRNHVMTRSNSMSCEY